MHSDVAGLRWASTTVPYGGDIDFEYKTCGGEVAYFQYPAFLGAWHNVGSSETSPGINYMKKATICVDSQTSFTVNDQHHGRVSAIAHEIGHAYGLNDRYIDQGTERCNHDERTIMDKHYWRLLLYSTHCDWIDSPQQVPDIARVESLYSEGSLDNFEVISARPQLPLP